MQKSNSFPYLFAVCCVCKTDLYSAEVNRKEMTDMASIRKRGNSYLIVVSMGYDCAGNRLKSMQQTVRPPAGMTPKQTEKWLNEQAVLFELICK